MYKVDVNTVRNEAGNLLLHTAISGGKFFYFSPSFSASFLLFDLSLSPSLSLSLLPSSLPPSLPLSSMYTPGLSCLPNVFLLVNQFGANVNLPNQHEMSPLSYACQLGQEKVAEVGMFHHAKHQLHPLSSILCRC